MPTTYNFTGQRLDSQTGLLYYNSRYYDPVSGRFVRADTTQNNAGGMDPFAYVGDNPETKSDPTGRCSLSICLAGGATKDRGGSNNPPPNNPFIVTAAPQPSWPMQWKIAASVTKFAVAYTKFAFDNLILRNGASAVADLAGCLTVCPVIDLKEFWAPMLGLKGTNTGRLQAALSYRNSTTGGFGPLVEALGHIANGAAAIYDVADLIDNFSSGKPNWWSVASDFLSLASLATYYLYRFLGNNAPRALLYISIGLGVMSFGAAIMANFPPPGPSSPSDGGDNRKQDGFGGGGGGFPPLPPLIPASLFLQPEVA